MAEFAGEKTEQPTTRRLEEAVKRGQFARSAEVQTVFVLMGALMALKFSGESTWRSLAGSLTAILGHLHEIQLNLDAMQAYAVTAALVLGGCVAPIVVATMGAGLLAGGIQNRFQTASEALTPNWERLNPVAGFQRIFSVRAFAPAAIGIVKLSVVLLLTYSEARRILQDPIFSSSTSLARIAEFLGEACFSITWRVVISLIVLAGADYGYQFWRNQRDLMMTKQELKDEMKSNEGDPRMKSRMRRRRKAKTQREMLLEVPKADVVVTNPTHLAIALYYNRHTMKAPKVVAKGSRLNALRIREIAAQHHVPIIENKPLARLMFKYARVGGEVPAQLYYAVAEVLAYVYRVNRSRYYMERNRVAPAADSAAGTATALTGG